MHSDKTVFKRNNVHKFPNVKYVVVLYNLQCLYFMCCMLDFFLEDCRKEALYLQSLPSKVRTPKQRHCLGVLHALT
jgi:hypothetical protein